MDKNVYLFELDSVITSQSECKKAQEKLFMELMDGNVVVLSYNQILSVTMFDLLDINQAHYTRNHILNLIEKKRICVSKYNDLETPGDYISSKLKPGAELFKFSCMRFLNDLRDSPVAFSDIKKAFEGKKAWRSWKDINIPELNEEQKKILHEYITVMRELSQKLYALEPATHQMYGLEHYVRIVASAVLAHGESYGIPPRLAQSAAENIETMLQTVFMSGNMVYRSACLAAIDKIKDADEGSTRLCKAILDMSYNYQTERSISDITVLHAMDGRSIAKTVAEYYEGHTFSDSESISLSKETKVLAWEIVDDFSNEYKKIPKENTDVHPLIGKFLSKAVAKTVFGFALIILSFVFGNYIESFMEWAGILLNTAVIGIWLVSEYMNWIAPTSIYDGFVSIIKLLRYFRAYAKFQKGCPYYVKVNFKERIFEKLKMKRDEDDD